MDAGGYVVGTYVTYLVVSIGLTVWVARTLARHGQLFLVDVFGGDTELATAVNRLLVVGFYLLNVGYVTLALKIGYDVSDARTSVEALSAKVGAAALVLGAVHFANLIVLTALRRHAVAPPRPAPQAPWGPGQPAYAGQVPAPFAPAPAAATGGAAPR